MCAAFARRQKSPLHPLAAVESPAPIIRRALFFRGVEAPAWICNWNITWRPAITRWRRPKDECGHIARCLFETSIDAKPRTEMDDEAADVIKR
jgi:hypothetical protein